ncbi:NAD-dependent succinate-semialdehyde dehydrogenase [Bosea sp. UC22_33]|uniref:NAD-dependent succinate-semialdehyde dehydrogenase n=1 Tax=Bosea sp. UC22_33 TaxID=3350165 RepID=UPI00366BEF64
MSQWSDFKRDAIFVGGRWLDKASGGTIDVTDPATGRSIGMVPSAGVDETRAAIEAAHAAFPAWAAKTAQERAVLLRKLADEIMKHQDALAELLTREQGKPLAEAKGEVGMSAAYVLWFAEEARRVYGDVIPSPWADRRIIVTKQPLGVVGAITPWNFPSSMLARKIGPALAAGCTIVAKPASQTPYSALAWGILAEKAGIPAGVVNVVTGDARTVGGELTGNPLVRKITFTGSTPVGKVLLKQAAETVKKVSMELGGNAPFIVFDDADLDRAVEGAIAAKFRNSGQTCVCTNRFYAQAGIYDAFVEKLTAAVKKLKVGSGLETGVTQGPLIDDKAVAKVEEMVADATAKGGTVATGGKRSELGLSFYEPTVIAGATSTMQFAREEIFGPVAPVFRFETEDEALRLANDTEYGLACYFYTRDLGRTFRVSEALQYGIVGVNEGLVTTEVAPFGGVKESGLGSEGSKYGLQDYLDVKYTCIGGLGAAAR